MTLFVVFMSALYGLIFGSFANAVAYRVPTGETLMSRSHCPKCNSMITWWQNIPVLSWLVLRGKCFNCKDKISFQYPFVEILTSVLFGGLAWKFWASGEFGNVIANVLLVIVVCYFAFIGVVLSIIDFKTMTLPTKLIYPTVIFSLVALVVSALLLGEVSRIWAMLAGGAVSFAFLFLLWFFVPKGMGFGDVRLMLLTGSILGWFSVNHIVLGVFVPFVLATVCLTPLLLLSSLLSRVLPFKVITRKSKIPFGPWIIGGALLVLFFGDMLIII